MKIAPDVVFAGCFVVLAMWQQPVKLEAPAAPLAISGKTFDLSLYPLPVTKDLTHLASRDKQGRCSVHHTSLIEVLVPIKYGLMPGTLRTKESVAMEIKKFPNALSEFRGGCLVSPTMTAKVLQCRKCENAKIKAKYRLVKTLY
mgnify:FL=1